MVVESIVVFGSEILARLSHGQTGAASANSGFGGASCFWGLAGCPKAVVIIGLNSSAVRISAISGE